MILRGDQSLLKPEWGNPFLAKIQINVVYILKINLQSILYLILKSILDFISQTLY